MNVGEAKGKEATNETVGVKVEPRTSGGTKIKTTTKSKPSKRQGKTKTGGKTLKPSINGETEPVKKSTPKRKTSKKPRGTTRNSSNDNPNEKEDSPPRSQGNFIGKRPKKIVVMRKKHYDEKVAYLLISMNKYPEKYEIYHNNYQKLLRMINTKQLLVV